MIPDGVALIAHDLKNALGWLESDLARLSEQPTRALAQDAHAHCINLQRRFVHFLTLYGAADGLATHCEDESPLNLLENLQAHPLLPASTPQLRVEIGPCEDVPLYWYFDHRLVHMALESALHNAARFATSRITLDATVRDGELVFSIEDDGPGLGGLDKSQDVARHATGLGTALCEAVAQAHRCGPRKGHIHLGPGDQGGARFELRLP